MAVGQHVMADSPFGSVSQHSGSQYQGNQSEDARYTTHSMGVPRSGRGRTILARPRIFVVGFEASDSQNLDQPAVQSFLDSLAINANVSTPEAHAPIQLPTHRMPTMPAPHFTPPPVPHFTPPNFSPPTPPQFNPPTIPRYNPPPVPQFNPPTIPHFTPPPVPQFRPVNPGFPQNSS
jgi:hypothetical protein